MRWINNTKVFLAEVRSEMKKVSFPARHEVIGTTVVVVIASVIFAIFLGISDVIIQKGYKYIVEIFS